MALATACAPGMFSREISICSSSVGLRLTNQLRGAARMPCTLKKSAMSYVTNSESGPQPSPRSSTPT